MLVGGDNFLARRCRLCGLPQVLAPPPRDDSDSAGMQAEGILQNVLPSRVAARQMSSDSGQKTLGTQLVQNRLLWIVPAAALGQDLGEFCARGD